MIRLIGNTAQQKFDERILAPRVELKKKSRKIEFDGKTKDKNSALFIFLSV